MDDYALHLYAGEVFVGALKFDPGSEEFALEYDPTWVKNPAGFPLSPHLPLAGDASSGTVKRFVENLLPEGNALDVASKHSNIMRNNIFGLIRHLGRETAGALSFVPVGQKPGEGGPQAREIPFAELDERIQRRAQQPFSVWDGKVRMSVAGFQDKLLVLKDGDKLFLADGSLASTHILKPQPLSEAMPFMVANEHFCMKLANRISQSRFNADYAAEVEILRVPSAVLAVKRFDRRRSKDSVDRLHIIDACQALDMSVTAKYERNMGEGEDVKHIRDGVSFQKLMDVRKDLIDQALGVQRIVLWAVTTLLLGNSDAHGKNLSFYSQNAGLAVTELYDLVSVLQYKNIHHDLAMAFGDEFELNGIKSFALADFCDRTRIPRPYFARELTKLCELAIVQAKLQAEDSVYVDEERKFVSGLANFIVERAANLLKMAGDIPKFKKNNF
ncbi:HipA domain-containing protein [Variovorax sp. LjRoot84]|uniref:HipA domain-containing protein n=1 Tax=Variovorax sp. LjRoot84 TaxID=3342340 RepID=UPI003ECE7C57